MADEQLPDWVRVLVRVTARGPVSEDEIRGVVAPKGTEKRQIRAYNLCDGTKTEGEIAQSLGLNAATLGRSLNRWEQAGVVFRLNGKVLHLYPIDVEAGASKSKSK